MSCLRFDMPLGCGIYKVEPTPCFACGSTFPFERGRDKRHISLTVDMPLGGGQAIKSARCYKGGGAAEI